MNRDSQKNPSTSEKIGTLSASPSQSVVKKQSTPLWLRFAPGAVAGLCTAVVANPLDVLKTRLQSKESTKSIIREISAVYRTSGFRGFYSGLPASIFSLCCTRSFYFALFSASLDVAKDQGYGEVGASAIAATVTSLVIQMIFAPIHMIRTLQFIGKRGHVTKPSIMNSVQLVLSSMGPRGFWLGLPASLIGTGETVMFWVLYKLITGPASAPPGTVFPKNDPPTILDNLRNALGFSAVVLIASGFSRFVASALWYPHEVLRTRMRESIYDIAAGKSPTTLRLGTAVRQLVKEGPRGAFGGVTVHVFRQVPTTMTTWLCFEAARKFFDKVHAGEASLPFSNRGAKAPTA